MYKCLAEAGHQGVLAELKPELGGAFGLSDDNAT